MRFQESTSNIIEIAKELNVASVLEGSVQREQDTIRISVRLFSAEDGFQIWGQTYDREVDSIFVIQDEIAQSVTEAMKLTLAPDQASSLSKHATDNLDAYNLYLQGRRLWNRRTREALEQAIEFFKQATDLDPSFAQAYSGIADSLIALANTSSLSPDKAYPEARDWARRALQIDNTLAEAHASIAITKLFYEWDWEGAEQKFRKALEVNPSYAFAHQTYALFLSAMGRGKEARKAIDLAVNLDPSSPVISAASAVIFYMARDFEEAHRELNHLKERFPEFPMGYFYIGWLNVIHREFDVAASNFRRALSLAGGDPRIRAWLGYALWKSGNTERARAVHMELEEISLDRYIDPTFIALLHLGMGEMDESLGWLEKGYANRSYWMIWLKVDPMFDLLRTHPRFQELISRMKFPDLNRPLNFP
jgi:serine/threonine-protein kinase